MAQTPSDDAVRDLARLVVSQVAPEELPVFSVLANACLADPARMLGGRDDVREQLGFGVGEVTVLLTPFAILAAGEVVKYLTTSALDTGKKILEHRARRAKDSEQRIVEGPLFDLRPDQLQELRRIVLEKLLQDSLEPAKAELVADAVVGELTIGADDG